MFRAGIPLPPPTVWIGILAVASAVAAAPPAPGVTALTLDPKGAVKAPGYFPIRVSLTAEKPAAVKKEPAYRAKPKYGTFRVGTGPKATYVLAVDEPEAGDYRIYVDVNRNGDLTDDGDGAWTGKREANGRTMYGLNTYVVRASWGEGNRETAAGDYGLVFYRFTGQDYLLMYRQAGRTGTIELDGKSYPVLLVENDADGLFSKPLGDDGKPVGGGAPTRPVWLLVDLDGDGKFNPRSELFDIRGPFKLGEKTLEATVTADGSTLKLSPTTRKPIAQAQPERPPLLAAGTPAPDFSAEALGGGMARLSDFKGKIVILDFWATWCGPCQRSMPHLEKLYRSIKDPNVVVLALCVWDEKPAYEEWMKTNKEKYSFRFAFDPAGRGDGNIARKLFNVSGIPTTYIIDKDGKTVSAVVGYREGGTELEEALKKTGIEVKVSGE